MLVVAALTTGQKIGIASVGGVFILFALVCSFVVPRRNPNFPGKYVGWFSVLCVAFVVAMLSAVIVFGKEKEAKGAETATGRPTTAGAASAAGFAAGKHVFETAGCTGCHTLKAAGATGTIGPNLDQLKPPLDKIVLQVTNGGKIMPAFKGRLSDTQIQDVARFVYGSTHA